MQAVTVFNLEHLVFEFVSNFGLPLENVNVFLANTMRRSATDKNGRYEIRRVPPGRYVLVVSRIGYEVKKIKLTLKEPGVKQFDFRLQPRALPFPEIVISAEAQETWQKNLQKFTRLFLGTSKNAQECTILNPEVLDFKEESKSRPFTAIAHAPLQIENQALGYRIYFVLEHFQAKNEEVQYVGQARFEELSARDPSDSTRWAENRLRAYQGSLRYFLYALMSDRLEEEGFVAFRVSDMQNSRFREKVTKDGFIFRGKFANERKLKFKGLLEVIYTRELEEDKYIEYRMAHDWSLRGARPEALFEASKAQQQKSWLALKYEETAIDLSGNVLDPLTITTYGYGAWERVAELLPWDYKPPDTVSFKQKASDEQSYGDVKLKFQPGEWEEPVSDYYEEGVQRKDRGNWQGALKLWWQGWQKLEQQGVSDPRLGIAFIELVTEKKATRYYGTASDIYLWGFRWVKSPELQEVVVEEARRILPLLGEKKQKQWEQWIKAGDPILAHQIRLFWIERDPRPITRVNERLLEHWERIAYARKHFTKNRNTVYGTDDRGTIYVKYGEPDRKKAGRFGTSGASNLELMRWITSAIGRSEIRLWDMNPEYEVWVYHDIGPEDPGIFLFSHRGGRGSFGLVEGVESVIPSLGYRYDQLLGFRYVYQLIYYAELMNFESFFQDRYEELEFLWLRKGLNRKLLRGIYHANRMEDKFNPTYKYAVSEKSDFEEQLDSIEILTYDVRLLDDHNQPRLAVLALSSPKLKPRGSKKQVDSTFIVPDYRLRHTLIVRNQELQEVKRLSDQVTKAHDNASAFMLPHDKNYVHFTVAAEAFEPPTRAAKDTTRLLALGKAIFKARTPLNPDPDSLEVSDLVLGVERTTEMRLQQFPFPLIPARRFWRNEPLQVYLEIYHLRPDSTGLAHYTIDFQTTQLDKRGRVKKKAAQIALSFSFDAAGTTSKEIFGVDISKLKPGKYLLAQVRDQVSERIK